MKKNEGTGKQLDPENEMAKQEKCDTFESKHVKEIIETFNNVLQIVEQYEEEVNNFVNEEESMSEDEETATSSTFQTPKVVKAMLQNKLSN